MAFVQTSNRNPSDPASDPTHDAARSLLTAIEEHARSLGERERALEARQRELGEERRQLTARVERHDELIAREATATAEARAAQVEVERLRKELEAAQSDGSGTCSR